MIHTNGAQQGLERVAMMDEILRQLETKIRGLIEKYDSLNHSNQQLSQGTVSLAREKEALLLKQQKAAAQIEGLVTRLKSIGKMP